MICRTRDYVFATGLIVFVVVASSLHAAEEAKRRPLVDVGPPFGKLRLVDEVRCGDPKLGFAHNQIFRPPPAPIFAGRLVPKSLEKNSFPSSVRV